MILVVVVQSPRLHSFHRPLHLSEAAGKSCFLARTKEVLWNAGCTTSYIKEILEQLWVQYIGIRESGTQLRHDKADASFNSIWNKNINGLRHFVDDTTNVFLAGLENWKLNEGFPKPWKNVNKQLLDRFVNTNAERRNRMFSAIENMRNANTRRL